MAATTKLDAKGRVSFPRDMRERRGLEAGAVFFIEEVDGGFMFRQAENPFKVLADHAKAEYHAGRTVDFFEFVAKQADADGE